MTTQPSTPDTDPGTAAAGSDTYGAMLERYLAEQPWATAVEHMPLVFHLKQVGARLDSAGADNVKTAALSSAFLQAFTRLDRRRPGQPEPIPPGQTTIFDELD